MGVQFGTCNFDGRPVDPQEFDRVRPILAPYGPDGEGCFCKGTLGILHRAFHTTQESRNETQPHVSASGSVITWDGRLDNREELIGRLGGEVSVRSTDLAIVAAAHERWGTNSFPRLIGDWALSIWDPRDRSVILAKDFVGIRHLYYSVEGEQATWCSILEPLFLLADRSFALDEEYIAGWLSFFPAANLTPYTGIHSVPPSCAVHLAQGTQKISRYWDFSPGKKVRYRTDGEYEEHFRLAFGESVRRRLRSDSPIVAELSGGMDSSSIVCMADTVIGQGASVTPRLDTVSFYDDSEPNWNERPYFTKVEQQRGRTGCHIAVESRRLFDFEIKADRLAVTPNSLPCSDEGNKRLAAYMNSEHSRVVLSGVGGDEVTGGVPTPTPQLEDLLARGRFYMLAQQLKVWALNKRKPWFHLLFEVLQDLFPAVFGFPARMRPAPWLDPAFAERQAVALTGYESGVNLFGPLPSFQENLSVLNSLRRQLGCAVLPLEPLYEKRYPYLDRDLLEFLYAIPREQIVRPGQRRSLMRRALVGIVPAEVLDRRRKAYVARAPAATLSTEWPSIAAITQEMFATSLGVINAAAFLSALQKAREGHDASFVILMRTFDIEFWLRNLNRWGILAGQPMSTKQGVRIGESESALMNAP